MGSISRLSNPDTTAVDAGKSVDLLAGDFLDLLDIRITIFDS